MTGIVLGLTMLLAAPALPVWTVESVEPSHAIFYPASEGSRHGFKRIGDSLTITLEKTEDGKAARLRFTYKLAASPPR